MRRHSGCGFGWMGSNWPLMWKFVGCSKFEGRDALDPDTGGSWTDAGRVGLGSRDVTPDVVSDGWEAIGPWCGNSSVARSSRAGMPSIRILVDPGLMQGELDSVRGMSLRMWFRMDGKQSAPGVEIRRLLEVRGQGCPRSGYWWILDRCRARWTRFEGCQIGCSVASNELVSDGWEAIGPWCGNSSVARSSRAGMPSLRILVDPELMQGELDSVRGMSLRMWFRMDGKQLALGAEIRRLLEVRGQGCPRSGYWWILN